MELVQQVQQEFVDDEEEIKQENGDNQTQTLTLLSELKKAYQTSAQMECEYTKIEKDVEANTKEVKRLKELVLKSQESGADPIDTEFEQFSP